MKRQGKHTKGGNSPLLEKRGDEGHGVNCLNNSGPTGGKGGVL
jgi:hypothetical protein